MDSDGNVKITDFDISFHVDWLNHTSVQSGTTDYKAVCPYPNDEEAAAEWSKWVLGKSDQVSVAATLIEMISTSYFFPVIQIVL